MILMSSCRLFAYGYLIGGGGRLKVLVYSCSTRLYTRFCGIKGDIQQNCFGGALLFLPCKKAVPTKAGGPYR